LRPLHFGHGKNLFPSTSSARRIMFPMRNPSSVSSKARRPSQDSDLQRKGFTLILRPGLAGAPAAGAESTRLITAARAGTQAPASPDVEQPENMLRIGRCPPLE
jgi:hypothetical protein